MRSSLFLAMHAGFAVMSLIQRHDNHKFFINKLKHLAHGRAFHVNDSWKSLCTFSQLN